MSPLKFPGFGVRTTGIENWKGTQTKHNFSPVNMANHCGNQLVGHEDITSYSSRFSDLHLFNYISHGRLRLYGVQHIDFEQLSSPEELFEHMDALERYVARREEQWHSAVRQRLIAAPMPVSWIFVHLTGLPSLAMLHQFTKLCSAATSTDTIFESKYSHLALTMTIACGTDPYVVTIRSTVNGFEEKIKLNCWFNNRTCDVAKFQRNIVYIKQCHEITAFFGEVLGKAENVGLTADQAFQLLSEKILSYNRDSENGDNLNTWHAYLCTTGDELFDFAKFQANYDAWIVRDFHGASTYLIGTKTTTAGYKKGKELMNVEARKHFDWINVASNIEDPVMRQSCMKKCPKHLPPMYLFLDNRKRRKAADPATLFAFNEAGATALANSRRSIDTYEVCPVIFNLEECCMVLNASSSGIFKVNSEASGMFDLYVDLKMLLECCNPDRDTIKSLFNLLKASSYPGYIFRELINKYMLTQLAQIFATHGFDTTAWQAGSDHRPKIAVLKVELKEIQDMVSSALVVDKDVMHKNGKKKEWVRVKYSIGGLRADIQTCMAQGVVHANTRRYRLSEHNNEIFKSRGVNGPYPTYIKTHIEVLSKMIYVLLPDGTLRFCIESQDPDTLSSSRLTHSQIASMGPVLDAGEMFLRPEAVAGGGTKWIIFKINNSSGHYRPNPSDGLQGVEYLLRKMLKDNPYFDIMRPRCSLVHALSTTRMSVVDVSNSGGVVVDETTQELGSNM